MDCSMNSQQKYFCEIFVFLHQRFCEIFGWDIMTAEHFHVYNDPQADCPMLVTNSTPIRIRMVLKSFDYWAQMIYQLSHEMCHYAIRQHKSDKEYTLRWFEEIICEAASLYFLEYSAKNWNKCRLSLNDPKYGSLIENYLYDTLNKSCTDGFQKCDTVEKLKAYNAKAENDRESHRAERNIVYREKVKNPKSLNVVTEYEKYVNKDRVTIDFDRWIKDHDCEILRLFEKIMPKISDMNEA